MKKIAIIIMTLLLACLLVACGSGEAEPGEKSVSITVPNAMLGGQSKEEIVDNAKQEDIDVSINEKDDTVTYIMTPEKQQEMLLGFKTNFEENLKTVTDNGDIPGLISVSYNDDMSAFTVVVNRETFQAEQGEDKLGFFYSAGSTYQVYAGHPEEKIDVLVTLVDQATDEEFETLSMRETFDAQQSPGDHAD